MFCINQTIPRHWQELFVRSCVRAFVHSRVRAFVRSCVRAFVHSCVTVLPSYALKI